jgi:hypothetical protein
LYFFEEKLDILHKYYELFNIKQESNKINKYPNNNKNNKTNVISNINDNINHRNYISNNSISNDNKKYINRQLYNNVKNHEKLSRIL